MGCSPRAQPRSLKVRSLLFVGFAAVFTADYYETAAAEAAASVARAMLCCITLAVAVVVVVMGVAFASVSQLRG